MAELGDLMAIADEERALFAANEERYIAAMVRADTAEAEVRALREALLHQLFDLHNRSTRPCPTCARSQQALGLDTSKSEGMLGCGFTGIENRIAWLALAPEPPEAAPAPAGGA